MVGQEQKHVEEAPSDSVCRRQTQRTPSVYKTTRYSTLHTVACWSLRMFTRLVQSADDLCIPFHTQNDGVPNNIVQLIVCRSIVEKTWCASRNSRSNTLSQIPHPSDHQIIILFLNDLSGLVLQPNHIQVNSAW